MRRIVDFVSGFATETTLALVRTAVDAINGKIPASPATTGKQDTGNTSLASIDGKITACNTGAVVLATGAATIGKVDQGTGGASAWKVDGSAVTQPVSGSVTATISGTPAVTVTSGAITETNSGTIATNTGTTATNTGTLAGAVNSGAVVVKGGGTAGTAASAVVTVQGIASMTPVQIGDNSGSLTVDAPVATPVFVRLSDGAAAVAPALASQFPSAPGQALAAGSMPVVLTAIQIAQLAQDATLTGGTQIAIAKGAAATGAAVSGNPVYVGGKDGSGNARPVLVSAAGNVQIQNAKGTTVSSTAPEASRVISASACLISRASMYNGNAALRYLQIHNTTSLPSNGAVPVSVAIIGTTQTQVTTFNIPTDRCSTGCVVATSTTGGTLTIGSSDALFTVDLYPTNV